MSESGLDLAAVNTIAAEIKAQQAKMIDYRVENFVQIKKVLTPDQFAKLLCAKKEKRKHKSF